MEIFQYKLKRKKGFREGIIILDKDGHFSEIAPLPGRSKETLNDVLNALQTYPFIKSFPSLEFGLKKHPSSNASLTVCAFFAGTEEEILEKAKKTKNPFAKLKIGHFSLEKAIKITEKLLEFPFKLRIDINRQFSPEDAIAFGKAFPLNTFEYIEEPMPHLDGLPHFFKETKVPFAIDEHLYKYPLNTIIALPGLKALVLKPTLCGNIAPILEKAKNIRCILSSSYESSIGLLQIAKLAHMLQIKTPLGIDTLGDFEEDLLDPPLTFESGQLNMSIKREIKTQCLIKI